MTVQDQDTSILAALLDAMPDAVLMSDVHGNITRANAAVRHLFGHDPAALIGASINTLMPKALADRHDGFMQAYLETGRARIMGRGRSVEGLRRNGTTFPLHISIGRADSGGNTQFVAILHDLSQRSTIEEALARTARLDAIGQMTGGISHDFNNILTVVMGNLELLDSRLQDTDDRAMLADALEAAELGAELTAGLNAFGRNSQMHCEIIDINAACNSAVSLVRRTFDPQYVISVQLQDNLPSVLADTTQLQSALINIALNARDAMPEGGKLIIRSEAVTVDDTYLAQELDVAQGAYVRISVTDTGRGMGPDTQQRIFEPFFTTKPIGRGTGLGMAMVYGFVRRCGGHVTVYSEIGHGTTIGLYFPVIDAVPEGGQRSFDPRKHLATNNQTVLVVEDNPQVRKMARAQIAELGYRVIEAESGDAAATFLDSNPDIDAVFTDLVMPGTLDGLALAQYMTTHHPKTRILLTSGYAEDILSKHNTELGHPILRKPYRQSALAKALSDLFAEG